LKILSERERQVLGLVAQGYGTQEIAKQLLVSAKTVETYRARIVEKLGLRTRNEIVRFAIQMGLLTCETLASTPLGKTSWRLSASSSRPVSPQRRACQAFHPR